MSADHCEGEAVLVTGAQGFVGSWLAERLSSRARAWSRLGLASAWEWYQRRLA